MKVPSPCQAIIVEPQWRIQFYKSDLAVERLDLALKVNMGLLTRFASFS